MGKDHIYSCFNHFDNDGDGLLDLDEFQQLCYGLLRNDRGIVYKLEPSRLKEIFDVFDQDSNGYLDYTEFEFVWNSWCRYIIQPRSAIVVMGMQNDFITGKFTLKDCAAGHDGQEIITPVNELVLAFKEVIYTQDWHPHNHISFLCNVHLRPIHDSSPISADEAQLYDTVIFDINGEPYAQMLWPEHCIQKTWGAEFDVDLILARKNTIILKGIDPETDVSSVFVGITFDKVPFNDFLKRLNITDVYICGIPYDACVGESGMDSLRYGYRTTIVDDCCRGMDLDKIEETKSCFLLNGGLIAPSSDVRNMLDGKDRRTEHAYQLAVKIKATLNKQRAEIPLQAKLSEEVTDGISVKV